MLSASRSVSSINSPDGFVNRHSRMDSIRVSVFCRDVGFMTGICSPVLIVCLRFSSSIEQLQEFPFSGWIRFVFSLLELCWFGSLVFMHNTSLRESSRCRRHPWYCNVFCCWGGRGAKKAL